MLWREIAAEKNKNHGIFCDRHVYLEVLKRETEELSAQQVYDVCQRGNGAFSASLLLSGIQEQ